MMRSFGMKCVLVCVGLGLLLAAQSCTFDVSNRGHGHGGPPAHAPAHGYRARHSYLYYPSSYVYFDTTRKVYFYLTGGYWKMSVSLPSSITINVGEAVSIALDTDRPYRYFSTHKKKYPPGQLKKRYKQPAKRTKEQPPSQTREKYKQPARIKQTKKQPPGQTRKKDKETDKDKDKGKDKKK